MDVGNFDCRLFDRTGNVLNDTQSEIKEPSNTSIKWKHNE